LASRRLQRRAIPSSPPTHMTASTVIFFPLHLRTKLHPNAFPHFRKI
jgi:hypothetical protein